MNFWKLFELNSTENLNAGLPQRIRVSIDNINQWPSFEKLLKEGKIKFDKTGRARYLHGAPVGDLILSGTAKNHKPIYRECADEWFDPESPKAAEFKWPT